MKCPCCGYDSSDKRDYDEKSKSLLEKRDERTRKMLVLVIKKISKIESVPKINLFYFLQDISLVDDLTVFSALKTYDNSNPYINNKGLNYLKSIIKNYKNIMNKQKKSIEKRLGARLPEFPDEHKTE